MLGQERDNARRQLHQHLRGAAPPEMVKGIVDTIEGELLLPLKDEYKFVDLEDMLREVSASIVHAISDETVLLADRVLAMRDRIPRLPELKDESPFHSNIVRCKDLRVLRDKHDHVSIVAKLSEPNLIVEMSKTDMKRQLYTSQEFLDSHKLTRAAAVRRERFKVACAYSIDDEGDVRFVLLDGHHRALMNYADGVGLLVLPSNSGGARAKMSFRDYYRQHGADTLDW